MSSSIQRLVLLAACLNVVVTGTTVMSRPPRQTERDLDGYFHIADQLATLGRYEQAIDMFDTIATEAHDNALAPRAAYKVAQIHMRRTFDMVRAKEALARAESFPGTGIAEHAARDLKFINDHWDTDGSRLRIWFMASEAAHGGRASEAAALLENLCRDRPMSSLRPDAMLQLARLYEAMNRRQDALLTLRDYLSQYPNHPEAPAALQLLETLR